MRRAESGGIPDDDTALRSGEAVVDGTPDRATGSDPSTSSPNAATTRLHGVDGLRALAALWVVLFHIRAFSGDHVGIVPGLDLFIRSGSTGVSLFLVISGFCMYIPFAAGRTGRFEFGQFFSRRCRRLLPAFYATLVILVLVIAVSAGRLGLETHSGVDLAGQTAVHATLLHQLFPNSFYALNGAYWSLGLEWELYLLLPLLIVGIRRIGFAKTIAIAVGVNVIYRLGVALAIDGGLVAAHSGMATAVLPNFVLGRCAEFAFGMLAAELYVRGHLNDRARRLRYAVLLIVPVALATVGNPVNHLLFGLVFLVILSAVLTGGNVIARFASWTPLVVLGTMSYSLYLVHQPLVLVFAYLLRKHGAPPGTVFVELIALIPVIVFVAWLLFVTVERRTLTQKSTAGMPGRGFLLLGRPARQAQAKTSPIEA
jgi:peptidoglycan/LPS O-acetylase OafA/YrhL